MIPQIAYAVQLNKKLDLKNSDEEIRDTGIVKYIGQGQGSCPNYALTNDTIYLVQEGYEFLIDYYRAIPITEAKRGDIIVTHEVFDLTETLYGETCLHFAKIQETDGTIQGTTIRSKWGSLGIYEGRLTNLPVMYGNVLEVWTKK